MFFAYATDKSWCGKNVEHNKHQLDLTSFEDQSKLNILAKFECVDCFIYMPNYFISI